ncbi:hypothetical protein THAOC_17646, partial [Thalassiosira oceanica]
QGSLRDRTRSQGCSVSLKPRRGTLLSHSRPTLLSVIGKEETKSDLDHAALRSRPWIFGARPCIAYRDYYSPFITWPRPTANVNGSCPGSFVDQNFLERSLSFPNPEVIARVTRVTREDDSEQASLESTGVRTAPTAPFVSSTETRLCSGPSLTVLSSGRCRSRLVGPSS